ncbi:MAG: hypothetical protein KH352_07930 [Ruminococcus sp.]|nr:hypothetical protein [Candidatus Apopatosoma intestinale]
MILIIAEKPSLARNITAGIGNLQKKNGYFEGQGYIISWAFGHLFSLADIEAYNPLPEGQKHWSMDNIPCFPEKFRFELRKDTTGRGDDGVLRQFRVIESLCNRPDVDTIVNAGDADREGEIIVRLCIEKALKSEKKLMRLWLPDQTPETVAAALTEMKPETEYDRLADEGFARTYIDWLYGVNLTRYATLKTGTLLRVGRVIVPIVKAIYDRDMAIRNFKPDIYYAISSAEETNGEKIELTSKNKFEKKDKAKPFAGKAVLFIKAPERPRQEIQDVDGGEPGDSSEAVRGRFSHLSENQLRISCHRRKGQDKEDTRKHIKNGLSCSIQG